MMEHATLVRMANQISAFFAAQPREQAVEGIAGHIRGFWDPRMRHALYAHVDEGGADLEPMVIDAVALLRRRDEVAAR
jgi:formate dehydrogenase subunit delta